MARKDQELRPVMTRIPEGLRRRLERDAKWRRSSMNAEIVRRLQESFDIPDQAEAIASDIASEIESELYGVYERLNGIQSQIQAILSHLGLPDPVEEAKARKAKAPRMKLEGAFQTNSLKAPSKQIEREGFKIAKQSEAESTAAPKTENDGEQK